MKLKEKLKLIEERLDKLEGNKPAVNEPKTWKFTEDEKAILRNLPEKYQYIARDNSGDLFVYYVKPLKNGDCWYPNYPDSRTLWNLSSFVFYNNIFKSIKWEDKEPCEFRKFI